MFKSKKYKKLSFILLSPTPLLPIVTTISATTDDTNVDDSQQNFHNQLLQFLNSDSEDVSSLTQEQKRKLGELINTLVFDEQFTNEFKEKIKALNKLQKAYTNIDQAIKDKSSTTYSSADEFSKERFSNAQEKIENILNELQIAYVPSTTINDSVAYLQTQVELLSISDYNQKVEKLSYLTEEMQSSVKNKISAATSDDEKTNLYKQAFSLNDLAFNVDNNTSKPSLKSWINYAENEKLTIDYTKASTNEQNTFNSALSSLSSFFTNGKLKYENVNSDDSWMSKLSNSINDKSVKRYYWNLRTLDGYKNDAKDKLEGETYKYIPREKEEIIEKVKKIKNNEESDVNYYFSSINKQLSLAEFLNSKKANYVKQIEEFKQKENSDSPYLTNEEIKEYISEITSIWIDAKDPDASPLEISEYDENQIKNVAKKAKRQAFANKVNTLTKLNPKQQSFFLEKVQNQNVNDQTSEHWLKEAEKFNAKMAELENLVNKYKEMNVGTSYIYEKSTPEKQKNYDKFYKIAEELLTSRTNVGYNGNNSVDQLIGNNGLSGSLNNAYALLEGPKVIGKETIDELNIPDTRKEFFKKEIDKVSDIDEEKQAKINDIIERAKQEQPKEDPKKAEYEKLVEELEKVKESDDYKLLPLMNKNLILTKN